MNPASIQLVWSLASLSGSRIQGCHELLCRCSLDSTPRLGTSTCCRCSPKKAKKTKNKPKNPRQLFHIFFKLLSFVCFLSPFCGSRCISSIITSQRFSLTTLLELEVSASFFPVTLFCSLLVLCLSLFPPCQWALWGPELYCYLKTKKQKPLHIYWPDRGPNTSWGLE